MPFFLDEASANEGITASKACDAVHWCTLGKCWLAIGGVFTTRHRIGLPRVTFTSIGQVRAKSFERPMMVRLIAGTQNNTGAQGIKLPSSRKTKRVSTIKLPKIFRRHNRCRANRLAARTHARKNVQTWNTGLPDFGHFPFGNSILFIGCAFI